MISSVAGPGVCRVLVLEDKLKARRKARGSLQFHGHGLRGTCLLQLRDTVIDKGGVLGQLAAIASPIFLDALETSRDQPAFSGPPWPSGRQRPDRPGTISGPRRDCLAPSARRRPAVAARDCAASRHFRGRLRQTVGTASRQPARPGTISVPRRDCLAPSGSRQP